MIVRELIELLRQQDPELPVYVQRADLCIPADMADVVAVESIRVDRDEWRRGMHQLSRDAAGTPGLLLMPPA